MSLRRVPTGILLLTLSWASGASLVQKAPPRASAMRNPFDNDERASRAGGKLYARECATCHGANGEGVGRTPPLNRLDVSDAPPGALFWVLRNGSLRRGMPSFAHLPEPQLWQIVTYVRTLRASAVVTRPQN